MKDEVLKVAKLARIELQENEIEEVSNQLNSILQYFSFLADVNTQGVEPMFHACQAMVLRPDAPEDPIDREKLLQNAPETFEHSFRIPRVFGAVE